LGVYIDTGKAFDTVYHRLPLLKVAYHLIIHFKLELIMTLAATN